MGVRDLARRIGYGTGFVQPPVQAMAQPAFDGNGVPVVHFNPQVVAMVRLAGGPHALAEVWRSQWTVRICVNFLARNIAPLNIKVLIRDPATGESEQDRLHPMNRLLQRPNPRTSRYELIRDTVTDLGIYDTAFWLKRYALGNNRQLFRVPVEYCTPRGGDIITGVDHWDIDVHNGQGPFEVAPEDIVVFKGYDPMDTRVGSSVLESLRYVLNEEVAASRYREGFWRNSAGRDGVIERPPAETSGEWDEAAKQRFQADWSNRHTGARGAGTTPILEDGMRWREASFSPKDAEFILGREWSLDTAATAYNIPLAMLSRKGSATFASLKEFRKMLYVDTLGPWNAQLESAIWLQLVPDFGNQATLGVEFNIDEKLQGDFESQAEGLRAAGHVPYMGVNDMRKVRGLPALPGEEWDKPAKPANYEYEGDPDPIEPALEPVRLRDAAAGLSPEDIDMLSGALEDVT